MNVFIYESSVRIQAGRFQIWPLLCNATMTLPPPLLFRLGVPRPVACRLGEDGETRECVTSRGRVRQRILERRAPELLTFERIDDSAGLDRWIRSMSDTFLLKALPGGATLLTRRSRVEPRWWSGPWIRLALVLIHRYVHRNFKQLAETGEIDR